jgi:polyisoprenoid-binding protein YceI
MAYRKKLKTRLAAARPRLPPLVEKMRCFGEKPPTAAKRRPSLVEVFPRGVVSMKIWRFVAAGTLGLALCSQARAEAPPYRLDPVHTQVSFMVERFGFTFVMGVFAKSDGAVWLDEAHPEASRVEARVMTDSLWTGDATRDGHVRGPLWLKGDTHPAMTFQSTRVERTGETSALVSGDLTIAGVTRPTTLTVKLNKIGKSPASPKRSVGFSATGEISRADFGLTTAKGLIGDKVSIHIEALAEQDPAS